VIDKRVKTTADAVAGVRDGSTVLVAGFGAVGVADYLLEALHEQGASELTIVANNSGNGDHGLARLINAGRVRKVICSYPRSGDYSAFLNAYRAKSLELELVPQGIISERMRCHAAGLGGDSGFATSSRPGMTKVFSLRRRHHDLHDMRRFELDADTGAHRRVRCVDPFVPSAIHFTFPLDVGDIDDGREDLALVRTAERKAFIDAGERLGGLLVH
jgi:hypothetical protein